MSSKFTWRNLRSRTTVMGFLFMLIPLVGIAQSSRQEPVSKMVRKLLKKGIPGQNVVFDLVGNPDCNPSELVFLGETKPGSSESIKVLRSFQVLGSSCRGSSRVLLFDSKNRALGNYYVGMPHNLPDSLSHGILFFPATCPDDPKVTQIDFTNGIPDHLTLPCESAYPFDKEKHLE